MDILKFLAAGRSGICSCRTEKAFVGYRIGLASHRLTVSFNVFGTEELKEPPIQELKSSHMLFAFVVCSCVRFRMFCLS